MSKTKPTITQPEFVTTPAEEEIFTSLRASNWQQFHGQGRIKKALQIAISAAKERAEGMDHVLLYGPPGLGKTTLAHLIAKQLDANLITSSGTSLAKSADVAAILTNLQAHDVLFIDEIHRLPRAVEELLYSAMEDFALDIILGQGAAARTVRIDLPHFTLVGATTRYGSLTRPLRDRFGITHRLEHYQPAELISIITGAAQLLHVNIDESSAKAIAKRSRGTPRVALQLLKRCRDLAQLQNNNIISSQLVEDALALQEIDALGLTKTDRDYLHALVITHKNTAIGLSTLAAILHEDPITIEEVIEPYLLQIGLVRKTAKGRLATAEAALHLGKNL